MVGDTYTEVVVVVEEDAAVEGPISIRRKDERAAGEEKAQQLLPEQAKKSSAAAASRRQWTRGFILMICDRCSAAAALGLTDSKNKATVIRMRSFLKNEGTVSTYCTSTLLQEKNGILPSP